MANELDSPKAIWQEIKGVQSSQRLLGTELDEVRRVLAAEVRQRAALTKQVLALQEAQAARDREQAARDAARDKFQERMLRAVEGDVDLRYPGLRADLERVIAKLGDEVASRTKVAELETQVRALQKAEEDRTKAEGLRAAETRGMMRTVGVIGTLAGAGGTAFIAWLAKIMELWQ